MYPTRAGCPEKTLPFAAIAVGSYGMASAICDSDRARARARRPGRPPPTREDRAGWPRRPSASRPWGEQRDDETPLTRDAAARVELRKAKVRTNPPRCTSATNSRPRAPRYVAAGPL